MLAALGKMTDANQKEMLAGLFLSKFNTKESKAGLERLGYDTFQDAYKGLAELVGGNPLSVRNYRDEFDPVFPNGRTGYNMRKCIQHDKPCWMHMVRWIWRLWLSS